MPHSNADGLRRQQTTELDMPYDIEEREDGWAVVDAATREVAVVNGTPQTSKDIEDADDLVDLLNLMERQSKSARLS